MKFTVLGAKRRIPFWMNCKSFTVSMLGITVTFGECLGLNSCLRHLCEEPASEKICSSMRVTRLRLKHIKQA